ncbi:MAG: hypothetical protein AAF984_01555 [Verrucomicrobiota bacterium]
MNDMTKELMILKTALETYFEAAAAQKSENPPDLKPIFENLDEAVKAAIPLASPRLKHFLESASYRKAYAFLNVSYDDGLA